MSRPSVGTLIPLFGSGGGSSGGTTMVGIGHYENTTTIINPSSSVEIGIPQYRRNIDMLIVHANSVFLKRDTDYTIEDSVTISKIGPNDWDAGTIFDFIVITGNSDQGSLFEMLLSPNKYSGTKFNVPELGDITEEIRMKADDSLYAIMVTKFDKPNPGNITTTLLCSALGIHTRVITEFNTIDGYDVKETGGVVS